jgi:two-component system sensor histidine kinase/response regulator
MELPDGRRGSRLEIGLIPNDLFVSFVSNYPFPTELEYRYRIDGGSWQSLGKIQSLFVSGLPFGDHRLEAEVRLAGTSWKDASSSILDFSVPAPWYFSPLGMAFLLVLAFVAANVFIYFFKRNIQRAQLEKSEEEKRKAALENLVEERTMELKEAWNKAEAATQAKTRFLANISHDLRTPLNSIIGFGEVLSGIQPEGTGKRFANAIIRESTRLLDLLNQILDISKIESQKSDLSPVPFHLESFLEDSLSNSRHSAEQKGLDFILKLDSELPSYIEADPVKLRRVLQNLTANAVKFTQDGKIQITVRGNSQDNQEYILFSVQDTGIGISRDSQKRIFDHFHQVDSSLTRSHDGVGLGTSIAQQLVTVMQGSIGFSSEEGQGSLFWFRIPLVKAGHGTLEFGNEEEKIQDRMIPNLEGKVILLFEDYAPNQEVFQALLDGSKAKILLASNGIRGLEIFKEQKVDIIFMDVHMPEMDGLTATRNIRKENSEIPIVGLTADAFTERARECRKAGMNTVLTKPVRRKELFQQFYTFLKVEEIRSEVLFGRIGEPVPSSDGFEWNKLVKDLDEDSRLAASLVRHFIDVSLAQKAAMDSALHRRDFPTLHREVHSIKGGALNIRADKIADIALKFEQDIKKNMNKTDDRVKIEQYEQELARLIDALIQFKDDVYKVISLLD